MINPKKELFVWGPIDGRPIYIDPFVQPMIVYKNYFPPGWSDCIAYHKQDKITCFLDDKKIRDNGEKIFVRDVLNEKKRGAVFKKFLQTVEEITIFEKVITRKKLIKMNDRELAEIYKVFDDNHHLFWIYGFLPELPNWGAEHLLKRKLIKEYKKNFVEIFERLTAPEKLSFFQEEELSLLRIKLIENKKEKLNELKKHQKKYYWLRNDYGDSQILPVSYFKKRLDEIKNAQKLIKEINEFPKKTINDKKRIIKKYKIPKDIVNIAEKLSYNVWWQDFRKPYVFIQNHITKLLLLEISKRKKIGFKELCYHTNKEVIDLIGKNKQVKGIKERFNGFIIYYHEGNGIMYMTGKKANGFIEPFIKIKIDKKIKQIKGLAVSKGIVKGKVKILLSPRNMKKMNKDDILVSPMTSPDFIIAMKKASAVITDAGGITCHAAIVSRELKIPCIVGTKIATKVLKDGNLVKVDANKGIVKIL